MRTSVFAIFLSRGYFYICMQKIHISSYLNTKPTWEVRTVDLEMEPPWASLVFASSMVQPMGTADDAARLKDSKGLFV